MATRYLVCFSLANKLFRPICKFGHTTFRQQNVTNIVGAQMQIARREYSTFFTQVSAEELWKGVVGVSNAGKKKGRGKRVGRKKVTDLNKGQVLGVGRANFLWPGLNAPVLKGREVMQRKQLPPDPERAQEIVRLRDQMSRIRYTANPPLLRGWSGSRFPGQSVGPPDPVGDYTFEGFDSRVLEFKLVSNMTGTLGRKMTFAAMVVTGNKNGLAGFGLGKSQSGRTAIRVAKNRAAQRLVYIPRFADHTVFHNMFTQYHHSKLFIHKKEEGYGLCCHRVLKTCAELMGIKDLHCKVEGNTKNANAITRAFFDALVNQETHAELADRMGYHVVEFRKEKSNLPVVIASPSSGVVEQTELKDEEEDLVVDFERLYYGGRCELVKPKRLPFYSYGKMAKSYAKKQAEVHAMRNQPRAQIMRRAGLW
jgi:small subunit ribosomal protein S5